MTRQEYAADIILRAGEFIVIRRDEDHPGCWIRQYTSSYNTAMLAAGFMSALYEKPCMIYARRGRDGCHVETVEPEKRKKP